MDHETTFTMAQNIFWSWTPFTIRFRKHYMITINVRFLKGEGNTKSCQYCLPWVTYISNIQFRLSADKLKCVIELSMERRIKTFAKHFCILETERWFLVIKIACVINYEKDCDRVYQIKIDSTVPDTANSGSLHALFSEQA